MKKPVVLVVMDGVGDSASQLGNMVQQATTPTLDELKASCPYLSIKAHGTAVGLPSDDDMGNSEVGHNALGCGQIYSQGAKLVNESIESGKIYASQAWKELIGGVKANGATLHFLGLLSDGNVHSNIHHLIAMLQQAKADFEAQKAQAVRYADPTTIPHIFFHTLIADTARAFDGDPEQGGYNQFMATIKEFNAVLQSLYERGFVLVDIHDVAGPQQQADGSTKYVAGDIYLPAGKKPIVLSQDDVCYYEYMTDSDSDGKPDKGGDGFASRLLVKDGKLTCEYVDADGQTLYGSYDLVPLLDDFLDQHPDFSYRGARDHRRDRVSGRVRLPHQQ